MTRKTRFPLSRAGRTTSNQTCVFFAVVLWGEKDVFQRALPSISKASVCGIEVGIRHLVHVEGLEVIKPASHDDPCVPLKCGVLTVVTEPQSRGEIKSTE
ncbi:hypothetical protein TNCV_4354471 [Trichonephila clavipes]|nr:hypothetical protein TNCV_4354471 [Trichonephila clavipes]